MTTTAKNANYSEIEVKEMVSAYKGAETDEARKAVVESFAEKLGKTTNSVRAKLSREGVYKKPEKKTKSGTVIIRKSELVEKISAKLGVSSEIMESLEKATKTALENILKGLPE